MGQSYNINNSGTTSDMGSRSLTTYNALVGSLIMMTVIVVATVIGNQKRSIVMKKLWMVIYPK